MLGNGFDLGSIGDKSGLGVIVVKIDLRKLDGLCSAKWEQSRWKNVSCKTL